MSTLNIPNDCSVNLLHSSLFRASCELRVASYGLKTAFPKSLCGVMLCGRGTYRAAPALLESRYVQTYSLDINHRVFPNGITARTKFNPVLPEFYSVFGFRDCEATCVCVEV